jgi:N-hydroxyarylamine O-acetyltransferase
VPTLSGSTVASDDIDAYLRRLGVAAEPPSVDALHRLHRAHVERVPYETMWIHLDQPWGIEPDASLRRVAHEGRGGYCYMLNGAFSTLLDALGYHVSRHVGGVHGPDGPSVDAMTNHLVLNVHDLPDEVNPDGDWYVDVGLGDALREPLPLVPGTYEQAPLRFTLEATDDGVGDWHFTHDPAGCFPGMSFRTPPTGMEVFEERHRYLSTSPESGFVRVVTAQARHEGGVDIVRGCVLTTVRAGTTAGTVSSESSTIERRDDWYGVLEDQLGLRLDVGDEARERLWAKVVADHARRVDEAAGSA